MCGSWTAGSPSRRATPMEQPSRGPTCPRTSRSPSPTSSGQTSMALEIDHPIPVQRCLNCGHEMDAASPIRGDAKPEPGDFTVCLSCGQLMQFDNDLDLYL